MIDIQDVAQFKRGLTKVLAESQPGKAMQGIGLCQSLQKTTGSLASSYDIMSKLLTAEEYGRGLGANYVMTEDRWHFGQFLVSMSDAELLDIYRG